MFSKFCEIEKADSKNTELGQSCLLLDTIKLLNF